MKRKVILALLATMILTVGSLGTVFATESNQRITIQTSETPGTGEETPDEPEAHTHTWGDAYYVKDADAVYGEPEWIVDKEAVYEEQKVVDKEAWDEEIKELHNICWTCQAKGILTIMDGWNEEQILAHAKEAKHLQNGEGFQYGDREIVVDVIHHPEESHMENVLVSPEEGHWGEAPLISPEKGHWEHACADCGEIQDRDTGEVIKPGTITPENPGTEIPENPDTDKPVNPDGNTDNPGDTTGDKEENTQKPGTSTGDNSQTTTDDKTQSGNENTSSTENKSDGQGQSENKETATADESEKADTTVTVSTEKKSPKTGDTSSLIYLATLAGSAVTGGTAFGLRRKFKK